MALGGSRRKTRDEETAEVNLSPLLDMVFILLIFFVVTTTFTRETGVEVKKPQASSAKAVQEKLVKVGITREGTYHIYEKQVDLDGLQSILAREVAANPAIKMVIVADSFSVTEKVVSVIDLASKVGIRETSIAAVKP